jgi:hypothetical protein
MFLQQHDIVILWETLNNPALIDHMVGAYHLFPMKAAARTRGHGACICVSKNIVHVCQFLGYHATIPLAWLRVGDVHVGCVYGAPRMTGTVQQNTELSCD